MEFRMSRYNPTRKPEIIELVCKGYSNKKIADVLGIAEKTVKFHLTDIFKTHKVKSRLELSVKIWKEKQ
jgi:DNA-binding NarL/FixJ family response regulator